MLKITVAEDCGNEPEKQFVKDFNVAFAQDEIDKVLACVSEDIRWEVVGDKVVNGKAKLTPFLKKMATSGPKATELVIDNIISHGDRCAANGTMKFDDGSKLAFCDMYTFTGQDADAKLKELISFAIA